MKAAIFAAIGVLFGARQAIPAQLITQGEVSDKLIAARLGVHVIPTSYGSGESDDNKYAQSISLKIPEMLKNSLSAYGAVHRIWLAPKGWVGTAAQGADGSTGVELRPRGDSRAGQYVIYRDDGGCAGCAVLDAARYFPDAKKHAEEYGDDGEKSPAGVKIHRISAHLVTFSFLGPAGTTVHGAAFYSGNSDYYFAEMTVVLPRSDAALMRFLLQHYIAGMSASE